MSSTDSGGLAPLLSQVLRHPAALGPRAALCAALDARGVPAASGAWVATARLAARRGQFAVALALTLRRVVGDARNTLLRELALAYGSERWRVGVRLPPPMPGARALDVPTDEPGQIALALKLLGDLSGLTLPEDAQMPEVPLFGALPPGPFVALARVLAEATFRPGEALIRQGEADRTVYLLAQGRVRVDATAPDGTVQVLAALSAPALVGEMALLTTVPRRASVIAEEPALAWRLDGAALDGLAAQQPDLRAQLDTLVKARLLSNVLRRSRLFGGHTLPEALAEAFQIRPVRAGEEIFAQGAPSPGLYVVLHGQAEVWARDEAGERVRVATLSEGDAFGEMSLLTGQPTTAAVRMPEGGVLLHLPRAAFEKLRGGLGELTGNLSELAEVRRAELDALVGLSGSGGAEGDVEAGDGFEQVDESWLVVD